MAEPVQWQPDGTPRSPRFDDIYRSASGGLAQARHVFLRGCHLPQAWAGQPQWRILETGFGLGLNFLATWRAWKDDPQRPRLLHIVSVEAWPVSADDLLRSAQGEDELAPLAQQLAQQWFGLTPGAHRLCFEDGRVLLTLHVRDAREMLRSEPFTADSVFLDGFDPQRNPQMWDEPLFKGVARHCRRGTRIATWTVAGEVRRALATCGFQVEKIEGLAPKRHALAGVFDPAWEPKNLRAVHAQEAPSHAIVIGAGLSGAAAAASLALRGWRVTVLDAASAPAAGASGLPVGLLAPHHSPDDNLLSRLSRAGVRLTLQQAQELLRPGVDFGAPGVIEHQVEGTATRLQDGEAYAPWTRRADVSQIATAGLPPQVSALWHETATWLRPAALVNGWLARAEIEVRLGFHVERIEKVGGGWVVQARDGARAEGVCVVMACALGARPLLAQLPLNAVRGQVSWAPQPEGAVLPAQPVNGHGHFIAHVPSAEGPCWYSGSTFVRADEDLAPRESEQQANLDRLRVLVPGVAGELGPEFAAGRVRAWTGVRCTSSDRRPLVGEVEPGVWVSTAMGSRGLTFSALAAQLLCARLHDEPLPLDARLAEAIDVKRVLGRAAS